MVDLQLLNELGHGALRVDQVESAVEVADLINVDVVSGLRKMSGIERRVDHTLGRMRISMRWSGMASLVALRLV